MKETSYFNSKLNLAYNFTLSDQAKERTEKVIVFISILSFIIHLILIGLNHFELINVGSFSTLFNNPIAAIYTPFSFILIYEVYLLVFYLPSSTTAYIAKQYEIITLIVIRRIFKDLSKLEFTLDWFDNKNDLQFTYDIIATILLFTLIFAFYWLNKQQKSQIQKPKKLSLGIKKFIRLKKIVAMLLVPILLILAIYSFGSWIFENFVTGNSISDSLIDVNNIFFDEFFTVLIMVDVLLLLISFLHFNKFSKVIRNSGFIISTILIKLSFGVEGLLSIILVVVAVLFGVIILAIHNQFERIDANTGSV